MTKITFALPDDLAAFTGDQIGGEFSDLTEYMTELVRRDRDRRLAELRGIVRGARAGLISELTLDDIFEVAVNQVRARGKLHA